MGKVADGTSKAGLAWGGWAAAEIRFCEVGAQLAVVGPSSPLRRISHPPALGLFLGG